MDQADTVWFKSKIDRWMVGILLLIPVLQVVTVLYALNSGDREGVVAALVGLALVAGIYVLLVVPVRYGIASDALLVHFGIVRQRIRFDSIRVVYPTHNPLSSPALSLDRLAIKTGRGPLRLTLISPLQRDEFIGLLCTRAGLTWDGKRWARREHPASA